MCGAWGRSINVYYMRAVTTEARRGLPISWNWGYETVSEPPDVAAVN